MTPDDILRIARAVFPDGGAYIEDGEVLYWPTNGVAWQQFDPLNSNDDAFRVLAWLLKWRGRFGEFMDISPWHVGQYYVNDDGDRITAFIVMHDGTEAGLRRAITEAAKRVTS